MAKKIYHEVLTARPTVYRQAGGQCVSWRGLVTGRQNADKDGPRRLPKIESTPQGPSVFSSGFSIGVNWDDQDFVPNPRRGQYADLRYTHYAPGLGSDTRFDEWHLHYSRYTALSDKSVWRGRATEYYRAMYRGACCRFSAAMNACAAIIGGAIAIKCAEHPAGVSSPAYGAMAFVAWVGAGTMGPSVDSLNDGRWLPTAGVGYRFEFKPRVNIRLDYGIGKGSGGFYFQVGEAF